MIRVVVVEDSPVVREFLVHILNSDPEMQVIGTAQNGQEATEAVRNKRPDIVTMDIHMPGMDGYEATHRIMETWPVPIIIVSGSTGVGEVAMSFKAIEAGALAVVARPKGIGHSDYEATAKELIQTVKLMSEIKVVRRWSRTKKDVLLPPTPRIEVKKELPTIQIVAIGASTGGPIALQTILSGLPGDFPVPVLIVQHISAGFSEGFVHWLAASSGFPVHMASEGEYLPPGHAYVAPEGFHMIVKARNRIALLRAEHKDGLCPSVSVLFNSVAQVFGQNAIGVLLTGMGKDGAQEMKLMKDKGATTIAQDEASSIVHGMPGEAIKVSAATYVLPPERIAALLANLVKGK
jgi:two-component system chemotaxis response regulator CheB